MMYPGEYQKVSFWKHDWDGNNAGAVNKEEQHQAWFLEEDCHPCTSRAVKNKNYTMCLDKLA